MDDSQTNIHMMEVSHTLFHGLGTIGFWLLGACMIGGLVARVVLGVSWWQFHLSKESLIIQCICYSMYLKPIVFYQLLPEI